MYKKIHFQVLFRSEQQFTIFIQYFWVVFIAENTKKASIYLQNRNLKNYMTADLYAWLNFGEFYVSVIHERSHIIARLYIAVQKFCGKAVLYSALNSAS